MHTLYCGADGGNGYRDRCGGDVGKQSEPGPFNSADIPLNNQRAALRDFLSLYALTRNDAISGNGTWDDLPVKNGTAVRAALFGDGTAVSGLISKVLIGGTGSQNSYPNIRKVLDGLGISNSTSKDHNNHFHIYLRPSTVVAIANPQHLLANAQPDPVTQTTTPPLQTAAQGLLDYAQNLITGEELMFAMDVPSTPAYQTPIVLAQAVTPATLQPDYTLKGCQETVSAGDPSSAERAVDPAYKLKNYIQHRDNHYVDIATIKNISLLESTTHGKITSVIDNTGRPWYRYDSIPDYVGKDKAVFMAEFEGKRYKIVVELRVLLATGNVSSCPPPKLIKVNGKPVSGASDYNLDNITVTFADLTGGALGQTTGSTITLDTNAAGNNWYIDATPGDNAEYLPTSNPFEWIAKAGSAAAGKMDLLTVLLHEYGHALGIDHNPDAHDYMGTTLTAGVRRLPTADEMALMGQLVAQAKIAPPPSRGGLGWGWVDSPAPNTTHPHPSLPLEGEGTVAGNSPPDNVPNPFPTLPLGGMSLAFAGLLQRNRYGGLNAVLNESTLSPTLSHQGRGSVVQYAVAANSTLISLDVGRVTPADAIQQTAAGRTRPLESWNTQGSVTLTFSAFVASDASTGSGRTVASSATLSKISIRN